MTFRPLPKGWLCDGLACYRVDIGRDEPDALGPQEPVESLCRPRGRFFFDEQPKSILETLDSGPRDTGEIVHLGDGWCAYRMGPTSDAEPLTPPAPAPGRRSPR